MQCKLRAPGEKEADRWFLLSCSPLDATHDWRTLREIAQEASNHYKNEHSPKPRNLIGFSRLFSGFLSLFEDVKNSPKLTMVFFDFQILAPAEPRGQIVTQKAAGIICCSAQSLLGCQRACPIQYPAWTTVE